VSSGVVRDAAEDTRSKGDAVHALMGKVEADHQAAVQAVEGAMRYTVVSTPQGAQQAAQDVGRKTAWASCQLEDFADAVDTFDYNSTDPPSVSKLNTTWSVAAANHFGVSAVHYPDNATPEQKTAADNQHATDVSNASSALLRDLQAKYARLEDNLDQAAERVSSNLQREPTDAELRDAWKAGNLPMTAMLLWPHLGLDLSQINGLPPELQAMTYDERAQWLIDHPNEGKQLLPHLDTLTKEIVGQKLADQADDVDSDTGRRQLEALTTLLTTYGVDATIARSFTMTLGGPKVLDLVERLGNNVYNHPSGRAVLGLAQAIKATVERGANAMTDDEQRAYAKSLTDAIADQEMSNRTLPLSYLLRDGHFGTAFLDTMGDELDHMERSAERLGFWRSLASADRGVTWLFGDDKTEAAFDPVASYMSALGNNGDAALQFFTEGDGRKEYWIQHRVWSHDDFDGLLSALDAATTSPDTVNDVEAHRLVSETVDYLANRDKLDWGGTSGEGFHPGDVGDSGTRHLAHLIGSYMPSVDVALQERLPDGSQLGENGLQSITDDRIGRLSNMPIFEASELKQLVNVAVSTDDGFMEMRDRVSLYQNVQLNNSVSTHGYVDNQTANADARIEGFFVNAVGDTKIAEAAEQDARVQSWIDLGKDAVGAIPVPGGKVVEFLASHAIDHGANALSDAYANAESHTVVSENNYATAALAARHQAMEQALVNGGAITPQDVAANLSGVTDSHGHQYTIDDVNRWMPGGHYPTPDQYKAMSPQERNAFESAMRTLSNRELPNGQPLVDTTNYDQSYKDMFSEYFEKGDGDGN
jgi:hypothetical protein